MARFGRLETVVSAEWNSLNDGQIYVIRAQDWSDVGIYRPWSVFAWWFHFDAYAPYIFSEAGAIAGASGFVACGAAVASL